MRDGPELWPFSVKPGGRGNKAEAVSFAAPLRCGVAAEPLFPRATREDREIPFTVWKNATLESLLRSSQDRGCAGAERLCGAALRSAGRNALSGASQSARGVGSVFC